MNEINLTSIGLTESESRIYLSVLKIGTCTVSEISKESGFHRTNIYDILEQLKQKGLISYFIEGKVTKYKAADPENLFGIIREKEEMLKKIMPEIEKLYALQNEDIKVEIYKGPEGMKSAFRDILKENKSMFGFGIRGQFREKLPGFAEQWLRDAKKQKMPYYAIYTERTPPSYYTKIKYLSQELGGPVATFIYGNKININIWEPTLVAIVIKSDLVAHMYKKHFDILWKIAKK